MSKRKFITVGQLLWLFMHNTFLYDMEYCIVFSCDSCAFCSSIKVMFAVSALVMPLIFLCYRKIRLCCHMKINVPSPVRFIFDIYLVLYINTD